MIHDCSLVHHCGLHFVNNVYNDTGVAICLEIDRFERKLEVVATGLKLARSIEISDESEEFLLAASWQYTGLSCSIVHLIRVVNDLARYANFDALVL